MKQHPSVPTSVIMLVCGLIADMPPSNGSNVYASIWAQELKKGGLWNGPETPPNRTDYQPSA